MAHNNKHNMLYFEDSSMQELHNNMDEWQKNNNKRFNKVFSEIERCNEISLPCHMQSLSLEMMKPVLNIVFSIFIFAI